MAKIHDIDELQPHKVSMVICLKCYKRWISVRNAKTRLIEIQCPQCHEVGYVIETGESLER